MALTDIHHFISCSFFCFSVVCRYCGSDVQWDWEKKNEKKKSRINKKQERKGLVFFFHKWFCWLLKHMIQIIWLRWGYFWICFGGTTNFRWRNAFCFDWWMKKFINDAHRTNGANNKICETRLTRYNGAFILELNLFFVDKIDMCWLSVSKWFKFTPSLGAIRSKTKVACFINYSQASVCLLRLDLWEKMNQFPRLSMQIRADS